MRLRLRLYPLLSIAGYAGLDGGLRAMGRSRGGAARRNAIRHRRPHTQPGMLAAGVGFGSGELEHASSRSKYLKVPLVEDSERVAGPTWTGRASTMQGD